MVIIGEHIFIKEMYTGSRVHGDIITQPLFKLPCPGHVVEVFPGVGDLVVDGSLVAGVAAPAHEHVPEHVISRHSTASVFHAMILQGDTSAR